MDLMPIFCENDKEYINMALIHDMTNKRTKWFDNIRILKKFIKVYVF